MIAKAKKSPITADDVRAYLKAHPEFLSENIDLAESLTPPERALGGGIIDFQHYMVKNLQKGSENLKSKYEMLVEYCRENMSVQTQVHQAVLSLINTRSLDQLLQIVSQDLLQLFDVDVVRLAMESDESYDASFGEQNYSGIVFVQPGAVDAAVGARKNVRLVEDCHKNPPPAFDEIFADCADMIESCAMLRLNPQTIDRQILLAFGVRHKGRFHSGQGIELLDFLSQIVAHQLDRYLQELAV